MFGKTKDTKAEDGPTIEDFFGDEEAAETEAQVQDLHERLKQVEGQIHSQFTSMAAYAQIAQEQIELARAESKAETERVEHRVTGLIERERADRMATLDGAEPGTGWGAPDVHARLDALERAVQEIREGLAACLSRQKALADAITALFEPQAGTLPPPAADGPIEALTLR